MPVWHEIALYGAPQRFDITLPMEGGVPNPDVTYTMTFQFRNAGGIAGGCGWTIDLRDDGGNSLISGMPLVTGADLLEQFEYLALGGHLAVVSVGVPDAVPTFDNLGSGSKVFWVTLP